jgi:hypothetical protein
LVADFRIANGRSHADGYAHIEDIFDKIISFEYTQKLMIIKKIDPPFYALAAKAP